MRKRKPALTLRVPLCLALRRQAEYRSREEDGQDDIGEDNSHQCPRFDDITMAASCEERRDLNAEAKRLEISGERC